MTRVSHAIYTVALSGIPLLACGARTGLLAGGSQEIEGGAGDGAPPCIGREIPLELKAPNLYFVLDHSSSMREEDKWTNVRQVVSDLMTQLGAGARFGAAMFPGPAMDQCAAGVEVLSLRQGDVLGATANVFLSATSAPPKGGTPTAATLEALLPKLSALLGDTFVILATDGGPNCDPALSCAVDQCTINIDNVDGGPNCPHGGPPNCCDPPSVSGIGCLDAPRSTQAVADLRAAGIETFVIGIPGSSPYGTVLDELATVGGTARPAVPRYYRLDTADAAALTGALGSIAARAGAGCTFTLGNAPADTNTVHVSVNGSPVQRSGGSGGDGWSLAGTTLTLAGASCDAVRAAGAVSAHLLAGCDG